MKTIRKSAPARQEALRLLEACSQAHGAPGFEGQVRELVQRELSGELNCDRTGSLVHRRPGPAGSPKVMLTAHMDEVGFAVQTIAASGFLRLTALGGWWGHTLPSQRVRILTRTQGEVLGVIAAKPLHLLSDEERKRVQDLPQMWLDVGAENAAEVARLGIRLGDPVVPEAGFTALANPDLLLSKAFDNRAGLALLVQTVRGLGRQRLPHTLYAVATVQEELGMRGAQTAAALVQPDVAIVLEGPPADDLPGAAPDERQAVLGKGPQVRLLDPTAVTNPRLADLVLDTATAAGIPVQVAVRTSGGTDARAIHLSGSGVPTIVIGVPARYIHSHNSIIHLRDYLATLDLVQALLRRLDAPTVAGLTQYL